MYKAFKYKIFPTEPQKELIAKHIGSSRFVNYVLNKLILFYQ